MNPRIRSISLMLLGAMTSMALSAQAYEITQYIDGRGNAIINPTFYHDWHDEHVDAGEHTIRLLDSDFGFEPGVSHPHVCVFLDQIEEESLVDFMFTLNEVGQERTVHLKPNGIIYVGFVLLDQQGAHGSATVQINDGDPITVTVEEEGTLFPHLTDCFVPIDLPEPAAAIHLDHSTFGDSQGGHNYLAWLFAESTVPQDAGKRLLTLNGIGDYDIVELLPEQSRIWVGFVIPDTANAEGGSWLRFGDALTVNPDGSADCETIMEAVTAARDGMVLRLADAVYTGEGNREIDFGGKSLCMRSESLDPSRCVIDADGTASDWQRCLYLRNGEGPEVVIEGITFTGGYANNAGALYFTDTPTSATIRRCIFTGNTATISGGAVFCWSGHSPSFQECTFSYNQAPSGAGLFLRENSTILEGCIVTHNGPGEGIGCSDASPLLSCCDVYANAGGDWTECIVSQYGIYGNIAEDPQFCGDERPDAPFMLHDTSPCAPDANPDCGLLGAQPVGCSLAHAADPRVALSGLGLELPSIVSPHRGAVDIRYTLGTGDESANIDLAIYDHLGRTIARLDAGQKMAGSHTVTWSGADERGVRVPQGVYFCRLRSGNQTLDRRFLIAR